MQSIWRVTSTPSARSVIGAQIKECGQARAETAFNHFTETACPCFPQTVPYLIRV